MVGSPTYFVSLLKYNKEEEKEPRKKDSYETVTEWAMLRENLAGFCLLHSGYLCDCYFYLTSDLRKSEAPDNQTEME